jgi:hypothetical protein
MYEAPKFIWVSTVDIKAASSEASISPRNPVGTSFKINMA